MRKVTIVDIANELDVSPSTVSRALNGIGRMNEETRQEILELAKRWDYHPNPHAQRLKKTKTRTIGLIVPDITHHFYSRVINGVDSVLDEHGYQQIICVSHEEYEKEKKAAMTLLNARVDGLLVALSTETNDYDHIQMLMNDDVPVVLLDRMCEDVDAPYVMTDDFLGAQIATDHLVNTGCRNIAFLKGPENISTTFTRFMGYKEVLKKHDIPFREELVIGHGPNDVVEERLTKLVKSQSINGLLAHSDYHAFRAMETLKRLWIDIPNDISLIGYADEPLARYTSPKITTIKQPAFEMGKAGMELLLNEIETGQKGAPRIIETELIVRETTKG